jgi:hypothetical protein
MPNWVIFAMHISLKLPRYNILTTHMTTNYKAIAKHCLVYINFW